MAAGIALATFEPIMAPAHRREDWLYVDVVTRGELLRRVRVAPERAGATRPTLDCGRPLRVASERVLVRPGTEVSADTVLVELSEPGAADSWLRKRASH